MLMMVRLQFHPGLTDTRNPALTPLPPGIAFRANGLIRLDRLPATTILVGEGTNVTGFLYAAVIRSLVV
jgi:hypothetical protein